MALLMSTGFIFGTSHSDADNLLWRGQALVSSNWDNTTVTNWYDTTKSSLTNFTAGAAATFDDTGSANPVIIPVVVGPGSVTVSANTLNYIFGGAGSITNFGTNAVNLTKNNNATLTIQTTNGYTGVTTLNGGIVSVGQLANGGSPSAIGAASAASSNLVFNGGELQYTGPSVTINRGATLNAGGGTVAVSTSGSGLTNSGVIAGTGGLAVSGGGVLTLSGANTYSGGTIIPSGTVLGVAGGTLGSGNVTNNGTLFFSGTTLLGNNISGSGILTNAASATTILTGTNTFTGNFYNGTFGTTRSILIISNSSAALDGTSDVILDGGNASTLALYAPGGSGLSLSIPASVTLTMVTGGGTGDRAALTGNVNPCTWNGPINLAGDGSANEVIQFNASSAPLTINGTITAALANNYAGQVGFVGTGGVLNGNLSMDTNATFFVNGTWRINSSGNVCGGIYILGGTLQLGVNNALPVNVPFAIANGANVAIFDLNGYNQQIGSLTNTTTTGAAIITNSSSILSTLTYSNNGAKFIIASASGLGANGVPSGFFTNYTGVIAGKLGLTVAGGVLNLQGTNTYYGTTSITNSAILALTKSGSIARSVNIIVGPNATFSESSSVGTANNPFALGAAQTLTGAGATGTLAGNMYMQAGSSLVLNYNGSTPTLVVTNGTFTCTNSGVVTVNVPNSLPVGSSFSYLLVSNGPGGTVQGTVPGSVVVNGISDAAGSLAINGAGLVLTVTNYTPEDLEWRGTVNSNWDTVTANWYDTDPSGLDFTNFNSLDNVTFDDNVSVSNNMVNLTGALQAGMVTVSANNTNYTFAGPGGMVGASGLTKSGNSTLTVLTTNSYTGVTAINGGTVSANTLAIGGAPSAIGAAGSGSGNIVLNGGQLQYTGPTVTIDRGATLGANGGTVAVTTAGSVLTTSGSIAGNNGGGLTVTAGSGVFALSGINSYNGGTTVSAGGTLGLSGGTFGTGNVMNNGTLLFSGANTVINNISGSGILTNAPGGTLTLSGTNTFTGNVYSGVTNLAPGTVIIANSAALPPNTTVTIAGGNSSVLSVGAGVSTPTNVTLVAIAGNANLNRVTLSFLGTGGSWNGPIRLEGDAAAVEANGDGGDFAQITAPGGAIGTINGNITAPTNGPLNFNGQVDIRGVNSHGVINGTFTLGGGASVGPNDGASWIINSTNNTWGQSGLGNGQITLGADNALPVTVAMAGGGNGSVGILDLAGHNQQVGGLTNEAAGTGQMIISNSSAVYATFTYSNPANFYQAIGFTNYLGTDYPTTWYAGAYTNFTGIMGGNMGLTVAAGTLTLGGVNTYTGTTTISATATNSELALTTAASIGDSTNIIIGTNAIFAPSGQTLNPGQTLTGAGAAGTIGGSLTLGPGSSLVLNDYTANVPTLTVSNGTLTLSSANAVTINVSGSPTLAQASYLLISTTAGGLISGTPPSSVTVNGLANGPTTYGAYLTITGGQLYLTISQSPMILNQYPVTYTNLFTLYKGANPTFTISDVGGASPFEYEWFTNGAQDGVATNNSLQLTNVQSSFANYYCIVTNVYGSATSFVWSASVIADPTNLTGAQATYPSNVLSLSPIGYWRLNEADDTLGDGNPGALTHDYAGGNDALYTNVNLGLPGYNPVKDPSDSSALFGSFPTYPSTYSYAGSVQGIDVSATNGANGEFTVEAWVKASREETSDNGIVAKGYFGQEEFVIDAGAPNSAFRFEVRTATGTDYGLNSTVANYVNGTWYYLAGVCDEAHGDAAFYINGVLVTNVSIPAGSGIYNAAGTPMTIGARATSATSGINNQFYGNINDVAVFNYALSSNQIAAQYQASGPFAPELYAQYPETYTNLFTLYAGANPTFSLSAGGTPPFTYQWFTNGVLDAAATTNSLSMTDVQPGVFSNYCIVANMTGMATSTVWTASVIADPSGTGPGGLAPYPSSVLALNPIAYWRLNETEQGNGDDGVVAFDYAGGNDGIYTNMELDYTPYNQTADPSDTSAGFGLLNPNNCDVGGIGQNLDFAAPAGSNAEFSVECWVQFDNSDANGSLISKGYGNGGEEFALDNNGSSGFRFLVRSAAGTLYTAQSTFTPSGSFPSAWYHMVGVCDEANGLLSLYTNGQLAATAAIPAGSGILSDTTYPMIIGARSSSLANAEAGNNNNQDVGWINDVAVFNYALNSSQVANQYNQSGLAPYFVQEPVENTNVYQGATLTVPAVVNGTTPISFQWYYGTETPVPNQTNMTLVITNIQAGNTYYLEAQNSYGTVYSAYLTTVTVLTGFNASLGPTNVTVYAGQPFTYTVQATGNLPIYYQWYKGATAIPGATNASYTAIAASGNTIYSCTVSNDYNGYSATNVGPVTLAGIAAPTTLYQLTVLSNNPAAYWRLNEGPDNGLGDDGIIAHDYVGGHNGVYTNVELGLAGFGTADSTDTAALFGLYDSSPSNSYVSEIDNSTNGIIPISFAQPTGSNGEFSVEAWICSSNATQTLGAGIVTKGYGSGGEQFDLDLYNDFRFFVRDASGGVHAVNLSTGPVVGQWYHVVGVFDGANGAMHLYTNGVDGADTTGIASGLGVLMATTTNALLPQAALVSIGARASTETVTNYDLQFQGNIQDVALYSYALSAAQVAAHYQASGLAVPPVNTAPTNIVASVTGGTLYLTWPADHIGWQLQAQTNSVQVGLSTNWVNVNGSTTTNQVAMPINPANGTVFYRLIYTP